MRIWLTAGIVLLSIVNAGAAQMVQPPGMHQRQEAQVALERVLARAREAPTPVVLLGVVVALDPVAGDLVLRQGDGAQADLSADPKLLKGIRIGDPVNVVVHGAIVRAVQPLGAPSIRA